MNYIIFIIAGYLSGSVLYAYLIPKYLFHVDITAVSKDGNPGTTNAFEHAGLVAGIAVLLLELMKAFFPVFIAARYTDIFHPLFALVMAAPVVGHAFPLWYKNGGGKSIAASFGVLLGLLPYWKPVSILAVFYILFSCVLVISPHFFRSVVTFACFSLASLILLPNKVWALGCIFISVVVVWKHLARYRGEKFQLHPFFQHTAIK